MLTSAELQAAVQLLRQVATHAVAEDADLREDVDARLEGRLRLSMLVDAAIAGAHAEDSCALHQDVLPREAGEEIDVRRLDLARQPADELVERDDVVAVVAKRRRDDRERKLGRLGKEVHV